MTACIDCGLTPTPPTETQKMPTPMTQQDSQALWAGAFQQQRPAPADPHAARVAELTAQGWSPWNATARARSEASQRAKPGARQ